MDEPQQSRSNSATAQRMLFGGSLAAHSCTQMSLRLGGSGVEGPPALSVLVERERARERVRERERDGIVLAVRTRILNKDTCGHELTVVTSSIQAGP